MRNILAVVLAVAFVLAGSYYFLFLMKPVEGASSSIADEMDQRLNEIQKVRSLNLNTSVFENKLFQTLRPVAASTTEIKKHRDNPFVPF